VASGASLSTLSYTNTFGDFSVQVFAGAFDNGASLSDILSSSVSVTNTSGATHTLQMWVSSQDFTLPAGSTLAAESAMGGSVNTPTVTPTFQAYADKNNNLFGSGTAITDFTNGLQNAGFNGSSFDTGSAFGSFSRLAGNYSMTTVVNLLMTGGAKANFSSHENMRAVPEPASMLLLGSGLVGLARARRRARKA